MYVEIDDTQKRIPWKNLNEKLLHDNLIEELNQTMGYTQWDSPFFRGAKTTYDEKDVIEACIETHRRMEIYYSTKSKKKEFKIVFTEEDLHKILRTRELVPPEMDDTYPNLSSDEQ